MSYFITVIAACRIVLMMYVLFYTMRLANYQKVSAKLPKINQYAKTNIYDRHALVWHIALLLTMILSESMNGLTHDGLYVFVNHPLWVHILAIFIAVFIHMLLRAISLKSSYYEIKGKYKRL